MAAVPPPDPNRSVDLMAARVAATSNAASNDLQTDGSIMTKAAHQLAVAAQRQSLPSNIQRGLPPINPAMFSNFNQQHFVGPNANFLHISNCDNVQIGHTNYMNIGGSRSYGTCVDTETSSEEDVADPAIEDARIQELRMCEREISNYELQEIAQHVGLGWRRLIRFLGLQDYDVDEASEDCGSQGLEEVIYQLMRRWKHEVPNPTVSEMLYQVQRCDMGHLAEYLRGDSFLQGSEHQCD